MMAIAGEKVILTIENRKVSKVLWPILAAQPELEKGGWIWRA